MKIGKDEIIVRDSELRDRAKFNPTNKNIPKPSFSMKTQIESQKKINMNITGPK